MRDQVLRKNKETGLIAVLYLDEAFEGICKQFSAAQFDSRLEIMAALCAGDVLEADKFKYELVR